MNNKKSLSFSLVSAFIVSAPLLMLEEAQAQIYKCVNNQEQVFYNDKPCPMKHVEKKMKSVKDPKNGFIPAPFSPSQIADEEQNSNIKGVVIGGELLDGDSSSESSVLANQVDGYKGSAGAVNKQNSVESAAGKTSVVEGESAALNASTSNSTTAVSTKKLTMH